jgi:uncharacterized protein
MIAARRIASRVVDGPTPSDASSPRRADRPTSSTAQEATMTTRRDLARFFIAALLAGAGMLGAFGAGAAEPERIVLQVSDGDIKTWNQALNVADNLQKAYGKGTKIELVAFGMGINMLKMDAPVSSRMADAAKSGIVVYACENSMARFQLARSDMAPDVVYVEAGIRHIITRQREGWATIRP